MRPTPRAAALLGAALLTAGCASFSDEPPPLPVVSGTTLTEVLAEVEADAGVEGHVRVSDVAAAPDGSFVVLLTGDVGANHRGVLAEIVPGDGGLAVGAVTEAAPFADMGEVFVAPDGTVVALAPVLPGTGDPGSGDGGREQDLALAVLEPGSDEADVRRIAADAELGTPDLGSGVLSADGATLFVSLRWSVDGATVNRLAAVDVATGEVTASASTGVPTPGEAVATDLALRPDGGLAALVSTDRDAAGDVDGVVLAQYDADLRPLGEPIELAGARDSTGYDLHVLSDGAVVTSLLSGDLDTGTPLLVTARDGAVVATAALPGPAVDVAVDPAEELVHLAYGELSGGIPAGAAVATVELATGDVAGFVGLCPDGYPAPLAVAADGATVLATAGCTEGPALRDLAALLG